MPRTRSRRTAHLGGVALVLAVALVSVAFAGETVAGAANRACARGRQSYTGTIEGADFRVEMPERWNCTLVLYSHGYFPAGLDLGPDYVIGLANRPETESWLLDHGYALAASDFLGRTGPVYEQGLRDQVALLDWFDETIGQPRRTIALGSSMGGALSVMLAERYPDRFSGVAALCGPLNLDVEWNLLLDLMFTIDTLIPADQEVDLVRPRDPAGSTGVLMQKVGAAMGSDAGLARLALANAVANIKGWNSAVDPRPVKVSDQIVAMAQIDFGMIFAFGPAARVGLEQRAGGNPSWNVGIDYRQLLARSSQRELVEQAYETADLDLEADLDQLAAAPRIDADPAARAWLTEFGVPRATTPAPVITLHNVADAAVPDHERWYADQVSQSGDPGQVRQLFVNRATHCAFTASEEIVALQTLVTRIDKGRWPKTEPARLLKDARRFADRYQMVFDFATMKDWLVAPAFTSFTPTDFLRPTS